MIHLADPAKMAEYNSYLKFKDMKWDLEYETRAFGCTTLQVGAVMLTEAWVHTKIC